MIISHVKAIFLLINFKNLAHYENMNAKLILLFILLLFLILITLNNINLFSVYDSQQYTIVQRLFIVRKQNFICILFFISYSIMINIILENIFFFQNIKTFLTWKLSAALPIKLHVLLFFKNVEAEKKSSFKRLVQMTMKLLKSTTLKVINLHFMALTFKNSLLGLHNLFISSLPLMENWQDLFNTLIFTLLEKKIKFLFKIFC